MKRFFFLFAAVAFISILGERCLAADAATKEIFQIGRINSNYADFTTKLAREWPPQYIEKFSGGFDLTAGQKIVKDAFPGIQPGPDAGWNGGKDFPLRLHFKLDSNPKGAVYALRVGLCGSATGQDARLALSCNGKACSSAKVKPGRHEDALASKVAGETITVLLNVPADKLKAGENVLSLSLDKGAWVIYDYILLERLDNPQKDFMVKDFKAELPPFLVKRGAAFGHPLHVTGFYFGAAAKATVSVSGGVTAKQQADLKPGPFDIEVKLPEQTKPVSAKVVLEAGGRIIGSGQVEVKPVRHLTITLIPHSHLDIGYPDTQPNIVLSQRAFLDNAMMLMDRKQGAPMTWVAEASWPVRNLLTGAGPYEYYGDWFKDSPLTQIPPLKFWKDLPRMMNTSFEASVSSTGGAPDALNNRRAVDTAPRGWDSKGPAKGAWLKLSFKQPRPVKFISIRNGREQEDNPIQLMRITFDNGAGGVKTVEAGPMPEERMRLIVDSPLPKIKNIKIDILKAKQDDRPTSIYDIETWENSDPAAERNRLIAAIKSGRMEVTGLYFNFLTQIMPSEWLIRSMLRSQQVAAVTGVPMRTAMITDVPGYTFAIPDVMAGTGVKYYYTGINTYHSPNSLEGMPHAFYWQGPGGGRVMVFRSFRDYNEGWNIGFAMSYYELETRLPEFLGSLEAEKYQYDRLPMRTLGDITDDGPIAENLPSVVAEWNSKWAFPKIEIGTPTRFFEGFEKKYGKALPVMKGDWTAFWEDGVVSSTLETTAIRSVHRDLLYSGAFAAFMGRLGMAAKDFNKAYQRAEEGIYIYDEHTWGADNSVRKPESPQTIDQWTYKKMPAWDAVEKTASTISAISPLFSRFAPAPSHGGKVIAVVNEAWFPRDMRVQLAKGRDYGTSVRAIYDRYYDKEVKFGTSESALGRSTLFNASVVPAFGVKYYEVVEGDGAPAIPAEVSQPAPTDKETILENVFYKVTIDNAKGKITSILDKELFAELVDSAGGYGMNEFIYVPGSNNYYQTRIKDVKVSAVTHDSSGVYVTISGAGRNFPAVNITVRLRDDRKLIEFENRLQKDETFDKEGVYFAFPLKVPDGETKFDATGGVMALEKDQLSGACRDWIAIQDAFAVVGPQYSVAIATPDAPIVVPEAIRVMEYRKKLKLDNNTVFSYVFNNYWTTNYKAGQGGAYTFRYALTSAPGRASDSELVRFGADEASPARVVAAGSGGKGAGAPVSFLSVEPANVRVLGVKAAEDGRGIIVRLQETDRKASAVKVRLNGALNVKAAAVTDMLEKDLKKAVLKKLKSETEVSGDIPAGGYLTLRLW